MKTLATKNKIIVSTLFVFSAVFTQTAHANSNSPSIDHKQNNQKHRIVQGIDSGSLTGREAIRLGVQQGRVYNKEQRFKSDGQFTARERAVIHRDLFRSSKTIYRQKHDGQVQGMVRPATADVRRPGIHKRQGNQVRRIKQGVRSGELTRAETVRLGKQQVKINRQKRHFKADGTFTKRERVAVHKRQHRASKNIYRKKHNNRRR